MIEILIYGIVGDEWDGLDAKTIFALIAGGEGDIVVRINSPGGYCSSCAVSVPRS